jgi:hypothetical protein
MTCTSALDTNRMLPRVHWQRRNTTSAAEAKIQKGCVGRMLAAPVGSRPCLRWAQGPLPVPYRPGTPVYRLKAKVGSMACDRALPCVPWYWVWHPVLEGFGAATGPTNLDPAFLSGRALVPSCVTWIRTPPPVWEGSGTTTCSMAPDPASLSGRAPELPCVPRLRTPPTHSGGF